MTNTWGLLVAQVSNLLYRRFPIGRAPIRQRSFGGRQHLQVGNVRNSRLETCATFFLFSFFFFLCAAAIALEPITLRSSSGQFVVRGLAMGGAKSSLNSTNTYVRLDPAVVAVSCERIKKALYEQLELADQWRGTIAISLRPVRNHNDPFDLISVSYQDGWTYRLDLPDEVSRSKVIKALVHVMLLEAANRGARKESVEVPPWLSEGLAAHLESLALDGLALEPQTWTIRESRRQDPIAFARQLLRDKPPLTIAELSWPTARQLAGEDAGVFRASAQLLVRELIRLPGGRSNLRDMVLHLQRHFNWQTAFLRAFTSSFGRISDVEKWWALKTSYLLGVDAMSAWAPEQTLDQLQAALVTPVETRKATNDVPSRAEASLTTVLSEWSWQRQQGVLRRKIELLAAVRLRASHELAPLVEGYRSLLEKYLAAPRVTYSAKELFARRPSPLRETLVKLAELEAQREAARARVKTLRTAVRD